MSADNGCYIGHFPTANGGTEYRVIETAAIDNVDYGSTEYQDHMRVLYFGEVKPINSYFEALKEAERLYDECIGGFGICEYGIVDLVFDRPLLNKTNKEASQWLEEEDKGLHP